MNNRILICFLLVSIILFGCGQNESSSSKENHTVKGDEIIMTDAYIEKGPFYQNFYFKAKNNCGNNIDEVEVRYQLIDENGDAIKSDYINYSNVDDGQGVFNHFQITDDKYPKDLYAVKFVSFSIKKLTDSGAYKSVCEGRFKEPFIYVIDELQVK